jgi:long-chain acyl-CoA synthetase
VVLTFEALGRAVEEAALGFEAIGVRPGDRVGILSYNRPEWAVLDLAIMSLGAISVPIHHVMSRTQVAYVLRDAEVTTLVVENPEQMAKVGAARGASLRRIVALDPLDSSAVPAVAFDELCARGRARREEDAGAFARFLEALDPAAPCSVVYTSGAIADPKGVVLCHRGFLTVVLSSESVLNLRTDDVFLSHLPLSHLYERVAGHWCPLYRGCTIAYARDVRAVVEDLARVRPTVMVSVPLVYEKMRERVEGAASKAGRRSERIFHRAIAAGRAYRQARAAGRAGLVLAAANAVAELLVFRRVRERLGGRFRFPISGGAPLSVDTLAFFEAMGFPIVEGYGMTETHLIVTLTPPGSTRHGSCGRPIPGVTVRIAADGEVLVRGDTLMLGYLGNEEATRETIEADGWLHTGDIGRLDADGFLHVTDRKKNIIVNQGGKNIAPAPIENALRASRYIADVCVVGDRRTYLVRSSSPSSRCSRPGRSRGVSTPPTAPRSPPTRT